MFDLRLTNVSAAHRNPDYIADIIAPPLVIAKRSNCEEYALQVKIPDEARVGANPDIQVDIYHTKFLADNINLVKEIELADAIVGNPDIPSKTLSGNSQWDNPKSDPFKVVEMKKAIVHSNSSIKPNTLVLPHQVYAAVCFHPKTIDKIRKMRPGPTVLDLLVDLFDVERVLVPRVLKNAADPDPTARLSNEPILNLITSYVWGKNALLCYVPNRRANPPHSPLAHTFVWDPPLGGVLGWVVEGEREECLFYDSIRVQRYYDQKIVAPIGAYLWKNAVS